MKSSNLFIIFCFLSLYGQQCKTKGTDTGTVRPALPLQTEKPSSSFTDTLVIVSPSVVFYKPDSLQLEKIRQATDQQVFRGSMHEYRYQVRNARIFLKEHFSSIPVMETKQYRFLLFKTKGGTAHLIDLDTSDPVGMYVFDAKKPPLPVDMTNVDTQVFDYFSR
jgi:hypothetical protein